jgi:hypothetical protein
VLGSYIFARALYDLWRERSVVAAAYDVQLPAAEPRPAHVPARRPGQAPEPQTGAA